MKIEFRKHRSPFWSIPYGPASLHALLTVLATTSVLAQSGRSVMAQQINCDRPQGNVEVKACIRLNYEASDKRLNEVYKQLMSQLSGEERALLSEAQLGWIKLRDKTCEFAVYKNRGGTGYGGFLNQCLDRMTKQRTAELEKYLKQR
ncbi:lysozyme inhibitor LprI family protein [Microcoleus sp. OTE_8_concoct_300]|uniref:lysozyme inhibitor LprI family protein n=1 Tax=Microcoleus sp. OTE_8_concoct_300 TaxID=2964710 RepID=UPI00403FA079